MFNYEKNNRLLFTLDVNNMAVIKEFLEKIKLYQATNNLIEKKLINLIDNNIFVPIKTISDIERNNFVIFGKHGELHLNSVSPEIFFQILSNNYLHQPSKLAFLNFMANHTNQDGFLNMMEAQLSLGGIGKDGMEIEISDRKVIIDLNNYSQEMLNKKYLISQPVTIIEYFKVKNIKVGNRAESISATLGLLSNIELHEETPFFTVSDVFIYADLPTAKKLECVLTDGLVKKRSINALNKGLDIFGVDIVYPLFFSLKQRSVKLSQEDCQNSEEDILNNYFSRLRLC